MAGLLASSQKRAAHAPQLSNELKLLCTAITESWKKTNVLALKSFS
jgi:hypothetical protein